MITHISEPCAIAFEDVTKAFRVPGAGMISAISDLNLNVKAHETVCVIGPSGCGKSTLLNMAAGFLPPTTGLVSSFGRPIKGIGRDRIMVFQAPVLYLWMTVLSNVLLVGKAPGMNPQHVRERGIAMLREVGLEDFHRHYPYQLSGGMRQRLQLARALTAEPEVLLLDEPFGALDAQTRLVMQELLQEILLRYAPATLFITHDIDEALFVADRVCVMSARPATIVEEITVPWPRPRAIEMLTAPHIAELKNHLLARLRGETTQSRRRPVQRVLGVP